MRGDGGRFIRPPDRVRKVPPALATSTPGRSGSLFAAARQAPCGPTAALVAWASYGAGHGPIGPMAAPRDTIDLGGPKCPMGPRGLARRDGQIVSRRWHPWAATDLTCAPHRPEGAKDPRGGRRAAMFRGSGRAWVADVQWPIDPTRELSLCSEAPFYAARAAVCALTWVRLRLNESSSAHPRKRQGPISRAARGQKQPALWGPDRTCRRCRGRVAPRAACVHG